MLGATIKPNIRIKRGDVYQRNVRVLDASGSLIDCTGWTIWFTVKENEDDVSSVIQKVLTGNSSGEHDLRLEIADTDVTPQEYFFEIQIKTDVDDIYSSLTGSFIVEQDLTTEVS